jgi:hypothetical protein
MKETAAQWPALAAVGLVAGLTAWTARVFWQIHWGHAGLVARLGEVFVPMIAASALYFGISWWRKLGSAGEICRLLLGRAEGKAG